MTSNDSVVAANGNFSALRIAITSTLLEIGSKLLIVYIYYTQFLVAFLLILK